MHAKDIRRLLALVTMLLALALSYISSLDTPLPPPADEAPVLVDDAPLADGEMRAVVERVVDGDTIVVRIGEETHTVRFIGINSPETVDPRRPVQCFGNEASAYMREIAEGAMVVLVDDVSQGDVDKYDRILRYVEVDGVDIAEQMIRNGYAFEYTYNRSVYDRQDEYHAAEAEAAAAGRGLWAENTCNGEL